MVESTSPALAKHRAWAREMSFDRYRQEVEAGRAKEALIGIDNNSLRAIINKRGESVNKPIEYSHPADVSFGDKPLNKRQQKILDALPASDSKYIFGKREVSMIDLSALTASTGDEFAMFTREGKRLIVRGNNERIFLRVKDLTKLHEDGYRWSGHTHPGYTDADLIPSQGDMDALILMKQDNSAIYNAMGKQRLIYPKEELLK